MNNLPKRHGRELNSRQSSHKSSALTTTLPSHPELEWGDADANCAQKYRSEFTKTQHFKRKIYFSLGVAKPFTNPFLMGVNDVISVLAKVVVERCGFHHWIAQTISWGEVVSVFLYLLYFQSYDVINDVIMSDADCTPGREPRSVAASYIVHFISIYLSILWAGVQPTLDPYAEVLSTLYLWRIDLI